MALLSDYAWPGNIRELRNVLERVYVETVGEVIGRKACDEWVEEREQFSSDAWNMEARQMSLAERPVLITPYPGAGT
jgi:DNA-binding NtrC family response regulator